MHRPLHLHLIAHLCIYYLNRGSKTYFASRPLTTRRSTTTNQPFIRHSRIPGRVSMVSRLANAPRECVSLLLVAIKRTLRRDVHVYTRIYTLHTQYIDDTRCRRNLSCRTHESARKCSRWTTVYFSAAESSQASNECVLASAK